MSYLQDLLLREPSAGQVGSRFGAGENALVNVCGADQFDARIVGDSGMLQFHYLRDFGVRDVEAFQLLDIA